MARIGTTRGRGKPSGCVSPELQLYIDKVLATPRLGAAQERELMRRWKDDGDEAAAARIIETHLRFVVAIALGYRNYPVSMSDLVSEGTVGLILALEKFDPDRGTRFVTYASFWIRACVLEVVIRYQHSGKVGTGPFRSKLFFRLKRERAKLASRFGTDEAGVRHMARSMGMKVDTLREMLHRLDATDVSMDQPVTWDSQTTMKDLIADESPDPEAVCEDLEYRARIRDLLAEALENLDERERYVVQKRIIEDRGSTLSEVGEDLGVSRERARQIEVRARGKLRAHIERRLEA